MADEWTALEEAAKRATPGPWWKEEPHVDACVYAHVAGGRPNGEGLLQVRYYGQKHPNAENDATYIAMANPKTTLALIAAARSGDAARELVIEECAAIAKQCADERRNCAEGQPTYTTPERSFVFESLRAKESEANRIWVEILKLKQ